MREAILARTSNKQMEEEMRVLYVALTRARERLYLTASSGANLDGFFANAKANASFPDRYTIMQKCSSYLDWVFLAMNGKDSSSYDLEIIPYNDISLCDEKISVKEETVSAAADAELTERLKKEFAFKYKYASLSRVPSKLSVSRLYPDVLDENDSSATLYDETIEKAEIPAFFAESAPTRASGAERGTATHLFLQFCDFDNAHRNGTDEELSRLLEKKFLPVGASELIYKNELDAFMRSELIDLILSARSVIREQRFNVELSAKGFTSDEELLSMMENDKLAVQGVIDLILIDEDGNVSLFDYKTDRLSKAELENEALAAKRMNDAHGLQLTYYAKAVELLFGRRCSRISVYSTHAARLFEITPQF
jgi:ATP-dependent helicase/nuclease subunit A